MGLQTKKILASILFVLISVVCVAQDISPPEPPPDPTRAGPPGPPGTPIDDYLPLLFFVALCYGIFRKMNLSKK